MSCTSSNPALKGTVPKISFPPATSNASGKSGTLRTTTICWRSSSTRLRVEIFIVLVRMYRFGRDAKAISSCSQLPPSSSLDKSINHWGKSGDSGVTLSPSIRSTGISRALFTMLMMLSPLPPPNAYQLRKTNGAYRLNARRILGSTTFLSLKMSRRALSR